MFFIFFYLRAHIRLRPCITKNMGFVLPSLRIGLLPKKPQLISGGKKIFISGDTCENSYAAIFLPLTYLVSSRYLIPQYQRNV